MPPKLACRNKRQCLLKKKRRNHIFMTKMTLAEFYCQRKSFQYPTSPFSATEVLVFSATGNHTDTGRLSEFTSSRRRSNTISTTSSDILPEIEIEIEIKGCDNGQHHHILLLRQNPHAHNNKIVVVTSSPIQTPSSSSDLDSQHQEQGP